MTRNVVSTLLFVIISFTCVAQTDTIKLDQIEISSSRNPVLYSMEVRPVGIIDKQEMLALPVGDIEELIKHALGFDIRQRGANGAQADISTRGGTFDETLVLLNGIQINDPQTGHHDLDLPVDLDEIERIEMLRGSGACLYGTNAFAGALNFITSPEGPEKLSISASGGDFGLFTGSISGNFHTGKISHYISVEGKTCDGYTGNTDFLSGRAFYHGVFRTGNERLELQAGYMNKAFGANSFYSAAFPNEFEQTRTEFFSLRGNFGKKIRITPSISWRRHHDRFELFRDQAPVWYKSHNYHLTDVLAGELNAYADTRIGRTSAGIEMRYEHIFSNILGNLMKDSIPAPGEIGGFFNRSAERSLVSAFINHQYRLKKFTIDGGVLLHYSDVFGAGLYPGLDAGFEFVKGANVFISLNRSLRLPTYTDLYYQGPSNLGNPNLKPEESWNFETGLKLNRSGINGNIGGFYRMGYHLIDWVKSEGETIWHSENLSAINSAGIEVEVNIMPEKLYGRKLFIERIGFNYAFTESSNANKDIISYYVLDYLRHKAVLTLQHHIWKSIGASWAVMFQDRAGAYSDPVTGNEEKYKPFVTLDGRLYWDIKKLCFYISVSNITNTATRDFGAIPLPGRWLVCGIRIEVQ